MKWIRSVTIENFQSHVRSELVFEAGLNVIVGPSDNGKSAILRAVRWALYNEPRGSEFVRSGARECRVAVVMSDGTKVVRELQLGKSGNVARNRYLLIKSDGEEMLFEGFGTDVPLEIQRAHGMHQVMLDSDKRVHLSFGSQLEGPFLLTYNGSMRARAIGRVLGVHVVDAAVRSTQRDLRSVKGEATRLERVVEGLQSELTAFADLPEQEARLERAEQLMAEAESLQARLVKCEAARVELARSERESILTQAALGRLQSVQRAGELVREAEEAHRQVSRLDRLHIDLHRVAQDAQLYRTRIDLLSSLPLAEQRAQEASDRQGRLSGLSRVSAELHKRTDELTSVSSAAARLQEVNQAEQLIEKAGSVGVRLARLEQFQALLTDLGDRLVKGQELLKQTEQELGGHLRQYETLLLQLGKCPTCMQPVGEGSIKRVVAELGG
jgi:exonuclease SbcC